MQPNLNSEYHLVLHYTLLTDRLVIQATHKIEFYTYI